jgi:hypothetical protein
MRIFIQASEKDDSEIAKRAFEILCYAGIVSARIGGVVDNQAVVLVDLPDTPKALQVLTRAGLQAVTD